MGAFLKVNKEKLSTAISNVKIYIENLESFKSSVSSFLSGCVPTETSYDVWDWRDKKDPTTGDPIPLPDGSGYEQEKYLDHTVSFDAEKNIIVGAKGECESQLTRLENEVITPLKDISTALEGAQSLIEAFDGKSASLKEFLEGYEDGKKAGEDGSYFYVEEVTVGDQTTEQLKFTWTDADGNVYNLTIAEMVNSFYTEVGTTMNAMVAAGLYAESQGQSGELTKEQQQAILDGVQSFIGHAQAAHAFGVASMDDINGVRSDAEARGITMYSPEDIASLISGLDTTGGLITAMGALGGFGALSAYTLTDMLDKIVAPTPTEPTKPTEPTEPTNPTNPTDPPSSYDPPSYDGPGTPGTPDTPTATPTPTVTVPTLVTMVTGEIPEPIKIEPEAEDIDQLARDAFEEQFADEEAYAEYQAELIEKFDQLFNAEGQEELRAKLKEYGYNDAEIKEILSNQDLARNAFLAGEQSLALATLANKIATEHGIENFDTGFDFEGDNVSDFDYDYLYNGDVNEFLTNTNLDPTVNAAKQAYVQSKAAYDELAKTTNESIEAAKAAKTNLDEYVKTLDKDQTKWTAEQAEKYNEFVKKYNESYEKAQTDKASLDKAKEEVDGKKEEYDKAKSEYLKKIREENKPDPDSEEEQPVDPENHGDEDGGSTDQDLLDTLHIGDDGSVSIGSGETL